MAKAAEYFTEAIELDPDYAEAHAVLSLTRTSQGNFRHLSPEEVYPPALESVTRALELDESLPEAHAAAESSLVLLPDVSRVPGGALPLPVPLSATMPEWTELPALPAGLSSNPGAGWGCVSGV